MTMIDLQTFLEVATFVLLYLSSRAIYLIRTKKKKVKSTVALLSTFVNGWFAPNEFGFPHVSIITNITSQYALDGEVKVEMLLKETLGTNMRWRHWNVSKKLLQFKGTTLWNLHRKESKFPTKFSSSLLNPPNFIPNRTAKTLLHQTLAGFRPPPPLYAQYFLHLSLSNIRYLFSLTTWFSSILKNFQVMCFSNPCLLNLEKS